MPRIIGVPIWGDVLTRWWNLLFPDQVDYIFFDCRLANFLDLKFTVHIEHDFAHSGVPKIIILHEMGVTIRALNGARLH
jgi:hypothetical protein